ncbi:Replication factor A protein 1 [Orobanche hederae]
MKPKIYLLDEITPDTKNWTAKVSIVDKTEPRTSSQPSFIRFQKLLLADNKGAAAIIIDGHAPRTVTAKGKQNTLHEYAAVDEQLRHIIAALNFSVTDYHNISLSSTSASVVLINSNIERVQALQKWEVYVIHKEKTNVLQQQGDVFKKAQTNFSCDPEIFTSIQTLLTTEQLGRSDLLVRGKLARTNQNFIYPCCAKCHRLTIAAYGNLFECHSCNEIKNAIPRFRFSLLIYDDSGEIEVTVFCNEGEKIMQMLAPEFLNKYYNDESLIFGSINSILHQMQLKMKIQSKVFYRQDGTTTLSHTMQTLECLQLTSSDPAHVPEISASSKPETASVPSTTKEHPRSDTHPSSSSRGRASKAKKAE